MNTQEVMKKGCKQLILCFSLLSLLSFQSSAQVSMGVGGGFLKQSGRGSEIIAGGELYLKYQFTDDLRGGLNSGFYHRWEGSGKLRARSIFVPITVSAEYMFSENKFRPYVGLHVGALFKEYIFNDLGFYSSIHSYYGFCLTPVVGVDYAISDRVGLNCSVKYGFALDKNYTIDELEDYSVFTSNVGVYFKL